jgi:hypothetical protein
MADDRRGCFQGYFCRDCSQAAWRFMTHCDTSPASNDAVRKAYSITSLATASSAGFLARLTTFAVL